MDIAELMTVVVKALEKVSAGYMVSGSMATIAYGEPRLTMDVDIVVDLRPAQVRPLREEFPETEFYFSEEAAHQAIREGGMFNIIHPTSGLKADLIVAGTNPVNLARLRRTRELVVAAGVKVRFSSPEDVILAKLQFHAEGGSEKHLRDIRGVILAHQVPLDLDYIGALAEQWGLSTTWRMLLGPVNGDST
ncbi:MAG: hypothetical protein PHU85_19710 [Phycisphaerae bacterium]|nr:hypothetical protein [Phycisphaerae bacterium]